MTLILIKKNEFYFRKNKYWTLVPLDATSFRTIGEATAYINTHLKDCKDCKVAEVKVEFKEES